MEDKEQVLPKVCILTSGVGSRLSHRTKNFNKALLRVGDKAVISHTIDEFSDDIEFVITLGYKGDLVRQYLEIAHPEKKFTFIEIDKFVGSGTGPGYSILKCKEHLQCPFYFVSCDSIITWDSPFTNPYYVSWAGWEYIDDDPAKYCTIEEDGCVTKIYDKKTFGSDKAFVGVAFIKEYCEFWDLMQGVFPTAEKEMQIAPSILNMKNMYTQRVGWFDTGTEEALFEARKKFAGIQNLDKLDEELYVVGDYVIKYFHDSDVVKNRLIRAKLLGDSIPKIEAQSTNFYKYKFIVGRDLFKVSNLHDYIKDLLDFASKTIWAPVHLSLSQEFIQFEKACRRFYFDKTISRLSRLYREKGDIDSEEIINDQKIPSGEHLLKLIDWNSLFAGLPVLFHGDTYFGNIILSRDNQFKFIDWRQDFGGLMFGDLNYDLAKMYNSFLLPSMSLNDKKYYIRRQENGTIKTHIEIPTEVQLAKDIFEKWILDNGYDLQKIRILTALVMLNMSVLHEDPLREYLYYFGKYYLYEVLSV